MRPACAKEEAGLVVHLTVTIQYVKMKIVQVQN